MRGDRLARLAGWVGAAFFLFFGLWAFFAPKNFFDQIAIFPPYNAHFLHDAGAFQLGIGVTLLLGLFGWDGLGTALGGAGVGSAFHVIAHLLDSDQGGRATDPWGLGFIAVVLLVGAWARRPRGSRAALT